MQLKVSSAAFWDIDMNTLDEREHAAFIIARVCQYGLIADIKQLVKFYSPNDFRKAIETTRGIMDERATALAKLLATA